MQAFFAGSGLTDCMSTWCPTCNTTGLFAGAGSAVILLTVRVHLVVPQKGGPESLFLLMGPSIPVDRLDCSGGLPVHVRCHICITTTLFQIVAEAVMIGIDSLVYLFTGRTTRLTFDLIYIPVGELCTCQGGRLAKIVLEYWYMVCLTIL